MRQIAVFPVLMLVACGSGPNTSATPYTSRTYDAPSDTSPETMASIRRAMAENEARREGYRYRQKTPLTLIDGRPTQPRSVNSSSVP